jgi:hypothetical protein
MTVEKGAGVTYFWYDVPENALENIEPWTEVAIKIREITDDVLKLAIAMAPVGRARDDQFQQIKSSHYKGAGIGKSGPKQYRQVVGNRANHAYWVHEGTNHIPRFPVVKKGGAWMGPVFIGSAIGQVGLAPGPRQGQKRDGSTARWKAYPTMVFFHHYLWRGQKANAWLTRAGSAAYYLAGNH